MCSYNISIVLLRYQIGGGVVIAIVDKKLHNNLQSYPLANNTIIIRIVFSCRINKLRTNNSKTVGFLVYKPYYYSIIAEHFGGCYHYRNEACICVPVTPLLSNRLILIVVGGWLASDKMIVDHMHVYAYVVDIVVDISSMSMGSLYL